MNNNDEHKRFLPDNELDNEWIVVEIPAEPEPPYQDRIPSGYDPMGEIYLRGRAFRGLAGGRIHWWVFISGWIIFGGLALLILISVIASAAFGLLPMLVFISIPLIILWRGTVAKISIENHKNRRRY
jgi:hypothetical protein